MPDRKVSPLPIRTKEEVSDRLAQDWLPFATRGKRCAFSVNIGGDEDGKLVSKALSGEGLPEAHKILNSLLVDSTALFNTLMLFGGVFVPCEPGACDDSAAISQMFRAATEYFERMKDGARDHQDTLVLADMFKPLIPAMLCVIQEAAQAKGIGR